MRSSTWSRQLKQGYKSVLLVLVITAGLLWFVLRNIDSDEVREIFRSGRLDYMALAALTLTVSMSLRGLRWRVLLSAEKDISPLTMFWASMVGYLGNYFLPARAGEIIRSVLLGQKENISKSYTLATALTERVLDAFTLVLISVLALLTMDQVADWIMTAARFTAVLGTGALVIMLAAPRLQRVFYAILNWLTLPARLQVYLEDFLTQFLLGMRAFQHTKRALLFTILTVVIWLIDAIMAVEIARAFDLDLLVQEALLLLAALGLSSAAPSTPGYVGIYQFVAVTVLEPFGFTSDEALVYIITFQLVSYAVVTLWGLIGLWQLRVNKTPSVSTSTQ